MQSPSLPIQITSASPAPAANRNQGGGADGAGQFSQALSREMEQRQPAPASKAPASANPPAKADAPKPDVDSDASAGPDKAETPPATAKADSADKADAKATDDSAAAADPAAGTNPLFDMLAMVASFNPAPAIAVPVQAAASAGADPAATDPAGARRVALTAETALPSAAAARLAGQAVPAAAAGKTATDATAAAFSKLMSKADDAPPQGLESAVAALAEPRGATPSAVQVAPQAHAVPAGPAPAEAAVAGQPGAAAAIQAGAVQAAPAGTAVREARPEPLALKDVPAATPAITPLQQATLVPLQSASAVHGADRIAARVGSAGWDNQVAQKIVWMVAGKEQSATLTLNPPDMGPMQVVLSVTNDQATVTFSAAQPEVRQALQDAMPKLRDMMGESGIALGNASVHDGSGGQQQQAQGEAGRWSGAAARAGHGGASGSALEAEARVAARPARSGELPGLVDTFA